MKTSDSHIKFNFSLITSSFFFLFRKKLCEIVSAAYPTLSDEEIQLLLPKKQFINVIKITTHDGGIGSIYCVTGIPIFFQLDSHSTMLFPTIYTLWRHPSLLHTFTTHKLVISKLAGGANLMLPGIIVKEPITLYTFGKLAKGTLVSINTEENKVSICIVQISFKL